MYSIFIHKKAAKFLKSRSSSIKLLVKQKLESLREDPFTHPKLDIKKLKGQENVYRLRIGKIRIIYQVLEQDLLILVISAGGRGDVYKKKG